MTSSAEVPGMPPSSARRRTASGRIGVPGVDQTRLFCLHRMIQKNMLKCLSSESTECRSKIFVIVRF